MSNSTGSNHHSDVLHWFHWYFHEHTAPTSLCCHNMWQMDFCTRMCTLLSQPNSSPCPGSPLQSAPSWRCQIFHLPTKTRPTLVLSVLAVFLLIWAMLHDAAPDAGMAVRPDQNAYIPSSPPPLVGQVQRNSGCSCGCGCALRPGGDDPSARQASSADPVSHRHPARRPGSSAACGMMQLFQSNHPPSGTSAFHESYSAYHEDITYFDKGLLLMLLDAAMLTRSSWGPRFRSKPRG